MSTMETASPPPLMLCMENASGQEVSMQVKPDDSFHTFLVKARSLLGYEIDLNSVTRNQPVSLTDNIYQFLLNSEQTLAVDPSNNEDLYILDDGTQIRASQIHFDNEDPPVDLTSENIPFVKFNNVFEDLEPENVEFEDKTYKITASPVRGPKEGCLMIPFKLVCNSTSGFEAQFTKYLESNCKVYTNLNTVTNRNKSPRGLIHESFKSYDSNYKSLSNDDLSRYTREEILNMFKDSPVASLPYENPGFTEKRRHVRKSDPSRLVHKSRQPISYVDVDGVLIAESLSQNCFICNKYVDNNTDKLYLFDNEDQRLHRSSPQKKLSTQLKIICEQCLQENFKPCCMKSPQQSLNPDEYLVIQNNQQYIFQKTKNFLTNDSLNTGNFYQKDARSEFVKVEICTDGEILANTTGKDNNDVVTVKDERKDSSSDVEIIENAPDIDDNIIDNLEEADEEVIEFLGKTQSDGVEIKELKCRFCERIFPEINEVMDHGDVHKHVMEDGEVFPCPLCDYGYANLKWLKGHLKAAHTRSVINADDIKIENQVKEGAKDTESADKELSLTPVATGTLSLDKSTNDDIPEATVKQEDVAQLESKFVIKTEVKQEAVESSDEEIWIVHTADEEADKQLKYLLGAAKSEKEDITKHRCDSCSQLFVSAESLSNHKCRRRGRKRKDEICITSKGDLIKRSQGSRLRNLDDSEEDLLIAKPRKKKNKEPTSDPQIVTCHNCNESFTSKVRLKFHMQFHDSTNMLTPDGAYKCTECENTIFNTETELFDHVHFQHDKQRRWLCPVAQCGKTFYLRATLTKHSRTHTDTRRYVCGTCGKRFLDKQTLDEHGVTHLQIKPFQCHICLKQLTRRSRLRMHLRAHEEELCPRLVLVCAVCERAFRHHIDVQEHLTRSPECIEEFANELKEEEAVTMQLSPTSGIMRHIVQVAESPKLSKPLRREASGPEAARLLSRVPDEARPITRVVQIEKAFRCEYCEDVFYSENGLNNHRVIHKGVKNPFTCHICKVTFATYSRCTTHKTTHGFYKRSLADAKKQADKSTKEAGPSSTGILGYGDFPVVKHFLCEDCGRSYLHWTYLQVHRRMKHATDNYEYKCSQCDMAFPNSWSISYHRKKVHGNSKDPNEQNGAGAVKKTTKTNDYTYRIPCRDCDEVLPNKTALYKHRKKEHSDGMIKGNAKGNNGEYWCGYCNRRYSTRTGLSAHAHAHHQDQQPPDLTSTNQTLEGHGPTQSTDGHGHTCSVCGHSFRTLSMLTEHARVHTGERPFPCDVCGVSFRRSTAMRNHRLIHSGVRAWPCSQCPKRFRIRSDLRTHLRLKHPASYIVIEVPGLNPSPEEVMERLTVNNIPQDKIIEITKMSFPKGAKSLIPNSARALDLLAHVPRTQVACSRSKADTPFELFQPARRGRGIAKNPRKQKLSQRDVEDQQNEDHSVFTLNIGNKTDFPTSTATITSTSLANSDCVANVSISVANDPCVANLYTSIANMPQVSISYDSVANMSQMSNCETNMYTSMANMPYVSNSVANAYTSLANMSNNVYTSMANPYTLSNSMTASMPIVSNFPSNVSNDTNLYTPMVNVPPLSAYARNVTASMASVSNFANISTAPIYVNTANGNRPVSLLAGSDNSQVYPGSQPSTSQVSKDMVSYPIAINLSSGEDISELNMQLLLRDGVMVNGNQMMQLQLDDNMLLE